MERYLMYLRKSRMDTDFEEVSVTETLSRHRTILENLCKNMKLNVVEVLEEVVSGESLYTRPQMMRLMDINPEESVIPKKSGKRIRRDRFCL